jgi:hypothetical protein
MSKYQDYFDIDPKYFPCVDDSTLRAGSVRWTDFFPHDTFVKLLEETERVLSRQNQVSVWIEGAYGTGKSHAAWALKSILECPDADVKAYFARHSEKLRNDLLNKLLGHKAGGKIVVAHRYAASSIQGDRELILAVQERVREALDAAKVADKGSATLKESVIRWIEEPIHKAFFDALLKSEKYRHAFQGKDADAVLAQLKGKGEVHDLMKSIFKLASQEGITALDMDMDRLVAWLEDVIERNKLKALILIWDEFSEYFKNNRHSLTEFQKLAAVCQNKPFHLVIVTHESEGLFREQDPDWKKLRHRFHRAEIALPDNIAFDLIASALVKKPTAKNEWEKKADTLNSKMAEARRAVANAARVDEKALRKLAPLHPMAALLLKHIARSFKANQRSMFDFIKNHAGNNEVRAFQWFISHHGPQDEQPLLTIDHLWDFFYERGRDDLAPNIRTILDVYPRAEGRLDGNEKRVLKTVLAMQAVGQQLAVDIFKTTEANLALAFEGTDLENEKAVNIARKLVREKEILYNRPLGGGRTMFAAVTAGGGDDVERNRQFVRGNTGTDNLIRVGELSNILPLSPAQRMRWEMVAVSVADFTRQTNSLRNKTVAPWKMRAVIGFAKDDAERDTLRKLMKDAAAQETCKDMLFIDTSATPLGQARFDDYVDYQANALSARGTDHRLADDMDAKGRGVLTDWKIAIYNGRFVFYGAASPASASSSAGIVLETGQQALEELTHIALKKYPLAFDGLQGREMLFGPARKSDVEKGIKELVLQAGTAGDKEKQSTLGAAYIPKIREAAIAAAKSGLDRDGRVSIAGIFDALLELGFMPANLYGYVTGFLLRDYATDKYRWSDGQATETMTPDKLAEAIAEAIKHKDEPIRNYRNKFIVLMTQEERAFCALTAKVFGFGESQCVSIETTARLTSAVMKSFAFPLWVLNDPVVADYLELVNPERKGQSEVAIKIGKAALSDAGLGERLKALVTKENCRKGMEAFLGVFEGGRARKIAKELGAELLADAAAKFDTPEALWLWDRATGEERIRDLILDYEIVAKSNTINPPARSLKDCYIAWRDRLNFVKIPWEALQREFPSCERLLEMLRDIALNGRILVEKRQVFFDELIAGERAVRSIFNEPMKLFKSVYGSNFEELNEEEISEIADDLAGGAFVCEQALASQRVSELVEKMKRNQTRTRLREKWTKKTHSKTPRDWSQTHKTPILCLAPATDSTEAKRVLDILNHEHPTDAEATDAEAWLDKAAWLANLPDKTKRDAAFKARVLGRFAAMLPSVDEVRDLLSRKITAEPHDWFPSPEVNETLEVEAKKRYHAVGSGRVAAKIDAMGDAALKAWLKKLVKDNMTVGIEIIGEEPQ